MLGIGTRDLVDEMREQGYQVTRGYVQALIRERHLPPPEKVPGGAYVWGDGDIYRLRGILRRRGRGPVEAQMAGGQS